jgi:hypothetical protein
VSTEEVDPFDLLENPSEGLEEAVSDPFSINFRFQDSYEMPVEPGHPSMKAATVDLGNENVEVRYSGQEPEEKYITVISKPDLAMVESHTNIELDGKSATSVTYYLVLEDATLMYDSGDYHELRNPGVREVAIETPALYQQGVEAREKMQKESEYGGDDCVPPPDRDPFFTD